MGQKMKYKTLPPKSHFYVTFLYLRLLLFPAWFKAHKNASMCLFKNLYFQPLFVYATSQQQRHCLHGDIYNHIICLHVGYLIQPLHQMFCSVKFTT